MRGRLTTFFWLETNDQNGHQYVVYVGTSIISMCCNQSINDYTVVLI
jgi:hypothetical protein